MTGRTGLHRPGLVAPEVVKARRGWDSMAWVVGQIWPQWMVLRPREMETMSLVPQIRDAYVIVQVFDAKPRLDQYSYIPGSGYVYADSKFFVLRRKDGQAPPKLTLPNSPANAPSH